METGWAFSMSNGRDTFTILLKMSIDIMHSLVTCCPRGWIDDAIGKLYSSENDLPYLYARYALGARIPDIFCHLIYKKASSFPCLKTQFRKYREARCVGSKSRQISMLMQQREKIERNIHLSSSFLCTQQLCSRLC